MQHTLGLYARATVSVTGAAFRCSSCCVQVHDFWHVLTGCHTNVFGELALKALEFVQVGHHSASLRNSAAAVLHTAVHVLLFHGLDIQALQHETFVQTVACCLPPELGRLAGRLCVHLVHMIAFEADLLLTNPLLLLLQTGLPMAGMAVAGAQFKLNTDDRQLLWQQYLPWAAQTGLRCADLMCIYYEKHFDEDLQELRARWRITPAPPVPEHLAPKLKAQQQQVVQAAQQSPLEGSSQQ